MNITILDQSKHTLRKPALILRDLWRDLELSEQYSKWFQRQLTEFAQDVDFVRVEVYLNPTNNLPIDDIAVTLETAKHIALMSRTAKGRAYRQRLIEFEAQMFSCAPQPQFNLPTTYLDALKCLVAETEAHNETKAVVKQATHHLTTAVNILEQALPKANAFDTAIGSGEHMLISEAAKFIGVGQVALFGWLESNGWIFRRGNNSKWQAYAGKISGGLMAHRFTDGFDARGDKHTACTALITPRGALVIKALMQ